MKKMALVCGAFLLVGAGAQAQGNIVLKNKFNSIEFNLRSCSKSSVKTVTCVGDVTSSDADASFSMNKNDFILISPNGDEIRLSNFKFRNEDRFARGITIRKGISYPVQFVFEGYSANQVKYLDSAYYGRIENLALSAPKAAAPAPASSPSGAAVNLGSTQAVVGGKAYTITLNSCKADSAGTFTCAATTAVPAK
ncbi:hypothetical protein [Deinococcus sp.]|uniref:hypothetical protein n=1 Tax=Deinococcus sp. TaxID=47478 RepID=UPI003B58C23B